MVRHGTNGCIDIGLYTCRLISQHILNCVIRYEQVYTQPFWISGYEEKEELK